MRVAVWLVGAVLFPGSLVAQLTAPPGWRWATDAQARIVTTEKDAAGSADAMWFVQMPPGFHLTMGPGGNLFHPSIEVDGRFELESEFFLFPGSSQEEYGLFLGGRALEGGQAEWVAFVARKDGSAAVLRRKGGSTGIAREWRGSSGIVAGRPDGTARNVLKVTVGSEVVFSVNGAEVARLPRDSVTVDGIAGLRAGRGVNLHITTFDLTRRMAPIPARRAP